MFILGFDLFSNDLRVGYENYDQLFGLLTQTLLRHSLSDDEIHYSMRLCGLSSK